MFNFLWKKMFITFLKIALEGEQGYKKYILIEKKIVKISLLLNILPLSY